MLDSLNKAGTFVPVKKFKKPLKISMAVQGEGMIMDI